MSNTWGFRSLDRVWAWRCNTQRCSNGLMFDRLPNHDLIVASSLFFLYNFCHLVLVHIYLFAFLHTCIMSGYIYICASVCIYKYIIYMNKFIYVYIVPTCQVFSIQPLALWNYHVDEDFYAADQLGWLKWLNHWPIYLRLVTQPHWFPLVSKALFTPYFWAVYVRGGWLIRHNWCSTFSIISD